MRSYILILVFSISQYVVAQTWAPAKTTNPIQEYANFLQLGSGRILYKWEVDLSNDGKKEILLATKPTQQETGDLKRRSRGEYNFNIIPFTVYIPNASKNGYTESKGLDESDGLGISPGGGLAVDVTQCYVGYISQLKKWGVVTIQSDNATDKMPAQARIYAYTIEGDHLKSQLLGKYNPDKGGNAIYDQYLKEGKRTKVQLQEVTL
jgi:hypothetical protein